LSSTPPVMKRRLGEMLVDVGLITRGQLKEALASTTRPDGARERIGQTLVRLGFVSEQQIAATLSEQLGLDYVGPDALQPDIGIQTRLPAALARRFRMLPLREDADGTLLLACADPTDVIGRDDVRMATGARRVRALVAPATDLMAAIDRVYTSSRRSTELIGEIETTEVPEEAEVATDDDGPMIRLVDELITEAVERGTSDIHIEPSQRGGVVRFRIDGVLKEMSLVPRGAMLQLIARVKLMGSMDIAERRLPQDGRARFRHGDTEVDLRISSLPSLHGETIVIRLLRKGAERLETTQVGFTEDQLQRFLAAIERPQGLVLITGPTGSGKTSTLYAGLGHLADETCNIITLEDPIEYELEGINQTHILEAIGRTFARCLRTVLRQDPDVVMVGEIRDGETAELALQAAMTGHLVLSTLHTNDAPSAVVRLRDLGVASYLIASSLTMVVAQRLVRQVCKACAVPSTPTERQVAQLHLGPHDLRTTTFVLGSGCNACNQTGYKGRMGIFEVLPVDAAIRELLVSGGSTAAIARAARSAGMVGLREDGLAKAAAGLTTLEELLRVAPGDVDAAGEACPVCAQPIDAEFTHCPWCAYSLALPSCAACSRSVESGWRVCPDCATPVGGPSSPPADHPLAAGTPAPPAPAPAESMAADAWQVPAER
jgi:type IV pilus assembly protein PilB